MNHKDFEILCHLRRDARIPLSKISRLTRIPTSTVFDRIRSQEEDIILKHTCLLNFSSLGFGVRAKIAFKIARQDKEQFKKEIINHPSVNSAYRINNGFDFLVEVVFRSLQEMEQFVDTLDEKYNLLDRRYFFIIDDIKRENFLTDLSLFQ